MRVFLISLLIMSIWTTAARAKDDKVWSPQAPTLDNWKNYKVEIPGSKEYKKLDIPPTYDVPSYSDDIGEYGQQKFGKWWFSNIYPGDKCQVEQAAEGWQTIFKAFEPSVQYMVAAKTHDVLSVYVPTQPHPKGLPVAFVDAKSFVMSTRTAKTFVPANPRAQKDMVQAMRAGKVMIVKWVDDEGQRREDRYPLTGFADAFDELARRNCPLNSPAY